MKRISVVRYKTKYQLLNFAIKKFFFCDLLRQNLATAMYITKIFGKVYLHGMRGFQCALYNWFKSYGIVMRKAHTQGSVLNIFFTTTTLRPN